MRLAYFGLPLGACLLARDGHELATVFVSPVPAPGARRARRLLGHAAVVRAEGVAREVFDAEVERRLAATDVDLVVSWYWTRLLAPSVLSRGRLGAIGVHPSLLPRHRGPNPFYWAIDCGDVQTGVTVHRLEADYDTGAILAQARTVVGDRNSWQLARALDALGLCLLRRTVRRLADGHELEERPQDEARATSAPEPDGDALRVDFSWSTDRVLRRVRALSPVPGVALELRGIEVFVIAASMASSYPAALVPGEAATLDERVVIRTADGAIALDAVVRDGSSEVEHLTARQFAQAFDAAVRAS